MLTFELSQLISRHFWRWILGTGLLCIDSLFYLKTQIGVHHSTWEFTFSFLTSPTQSMMILPMLFFIMTTDVVRLDITNQYMHYLSVRATTRMNWFSSKLFTIFTMAVLYTIMAMILPLLIGIFAGLETSYAIGESSVFFSTTPLIAFNSSIFPTFVIALTTVSTLLSILSLYTHHHSLSLVIGAILCMLSYFTFARYHSIGFAYKWMLTTHMFLLPRLPTKLFSANQLLAPSFMWSYGYLSCWYIISLIFGFIRIRKMNL